MRVLLSTLFSVFHLVMKHYIPCLIYYVKTQPTAIDAEVWVSSSPFKEKVKSPSFPSVTRNSHLTNKHEADRRSLFFVQGAVPGDCRVFWGCSGPVLGFTDTRGNSGLTWEQILSTTHVRCVCFSAFASMRYDNCNRTKLLKSRQVNYGVILAEPIPKKIW